MGPSGSEVRRGVAWRARCRPRDRQWDRQRRSAATRNRRRVSCPYLETRSCASQPTAGTRRGQAMRHGELTV